MKLDIKKDKRSKGFYFHKSHISGCTNVKSLASKDITKECDNGLFTRNYINLEYLVLLGCSCNMTVYSINTNRL